MRVTILSLLILSGIASSQERRTLKLDHSYIQKIYWFKERQFFKALITDSLFSNLGFLGDPLNEVKIERDETIENGSFKLEFAGLEAEYKESNYESRSNLYRCLNMIITSPYHEFLFDQNILKVGMKVDDLTGVLHGAIPAGDQTEILIHFVPTDFSMSIRVDPESRLVTKIEFSEIFY